MDNEYRNNSQEAEECVIASMLINPACIIDVMELLQESDFFFCQTRTIFAAIAELDNERQSIDPMLVIQKLTAMGALSDAGGMGYLAEIASNVSTSSNVAAYAKNVKDKSRERALIAIAQAMIGEVVNGTDGTDAKINNALSLPMTLEHGEKGEKCTDDFLREASEDLEIRHAANGRITGLKTHYPALDKRFHGLQPGQLMILAGRPGSGKTSLALNLALNAIFDPKPGVVLFFSLEMTGKELTEKMVCAVGGIDYGLYKMGLPIGNEASRAEFPKVEPAFRKIKEARSLIIDDRSGITFQQLRSKAIRVKRKNYAIKAMYVDYLTLIRTPGRENRVLEVGALSRGMKGLAKELECPIICLAQLSRKVEERADKRPIMHDLRDSGEIEQDADIITMIYRDDVYNEESERKGIAEIITVKNRSGEAGTDYLSADLRHSRFTELPEDYTPPQKGNGGGKARAF